MDLVKTRITECGKVVLPARYRKSLGVNPGDEVLLVLEDGEVRIFTPKRAVELAQAQVREYVPEGRSLSNELIRERREEFHD